MPRGMRRSKQRRSQRRKPSEACAWGSSYEPISDQSRRVALCNWPIFSLARWRGALRSVHEALLECECHRLDAAADSQLVKTLLAWNFAVDRPTSSRCAISGYSALLTMNASLSFTRRGDRDLALPGKVARLGIRHLPGACGTSRVACLSYERKG